MLEGLKLQRETFRVRPRQRGATAFGASDEVFNVWTVQEEGRHAKVGTVAKGTKLLEQTAPADKAGIVIKCAKESFGGLYERC